MTVYTEVLEASCEALHREGTRTEDRMSSKDRVVS